MTTSAVSLIGKQVIVTIDRPLGSLHPKHRFRYEVNYGFVEGTVSADGEGIDAYVLGIDHPAATYSGLCIAVVHRTNDDDDKLVVVPQEKNTMTDDEIRRLTHFQEQFFQSIIVRTR